MTPSNPNRNDPERPTFLESTPLEASASLEDSAPLDLIDEVKRVAPQTNSSIGLPAPDLNVPITQAHSSINERENRNQPAPAVDIPLTEKLEYQEVSPFTRQPPLETADAGEVIVQLMEERLVVDRKRRKIGEIIVRKEIETQMIEVPVRREKLIIEQVGSAARQLAAIDLGQPELDGVEFANAVSSAAINGEFTSIKAASQFLGTIAASQTELDCQAVQIKIVVENAEQARLYQQWFDRYSVNNAVTNNAATD